MNKVLFVKGYHKIPSKILEYLENGFTVYNAPRPLYGVDVWQDDFRHGVFYAAVLPENHVFDEFGDAAFQHKRNKELDGYECQIVTRKQVMKYGEKLAEKYNVDLDEFDYEDIVVSFIRANSTKNES